MGHLDGLIKLPGAPNNSIVEEVPTEDDDFTPGEETPQPGSEGAPQKPGEIDAERAWVPIFATSDPSTLNAPSDAKAEVMSGDAGDFVRVRSGSSGSAIAFDVSKGVLEQIAGKHATFDIVVRVSFACALPEIAAVIDRHAKAIRPVLRRHGIPRTHVRDAAKTGSRSDQNRARSPARRAKHGRGLDLRPSLALAVGGRSRRRPRTRVPRTLPAARPHASARGELRPIRHRSQMRHSGGGRKPSFLRESRAICGGTSRAWCRSIVHQPRSFQMISATQIKPKPRSSARRTASSALSITWKGRT